MAYALRNIINVSDTSAIKHFSDKTLSISIDPDGIAFAVLDEAICQYMALVDNQFKQVINKNISEEALQEFFQNIPLLNESFKKTHVAIFTPHFVLVPAKAYDPEHKEKIFSFCASVPPSHQLMADRLNILDAYGIYPIHSNLISVLQQKYKDICIKHHGSVFIETMLAAFNIQSGHADVVIHVKNSYFEILLIENQKLILYQSFKYHVFDDLLYYLFHILEIHNMAANEKHLLIIGKLPLDTNEYATLASFFKKTTLPGRNDAFKYSKDFENIPSHFYYTLLNLVACG